MRSPSFPLSDQKDLLTFPLGFCLSDKKKKKKSSSRFSRGHLPVLGGLSRGPCAPCAGPWFCLLGPPTPTPQAWSFPVPATAAGSGLREALGSSWAERALGPPASKYGLLHSAKLTALHVPSRWDPSAPPSPTNTASREPLVTNHKRPSTLSPVKA